MGKQKTIKIDVSGENGGKGHEGYTGGRGSDGYYFSSDGDNGDKGGPGYEGDDGIEAGRLYINLSVNEAAQDIVVSRQGFPDEHLNLSDVHSRIKIDVSGGDGGRGGLGGRGGRGGNGHRGRNADRYNRGGRGGDGGRGGLGGRGGDGGHGGDAGLINISLDEYDTDALMGIDYKINGGRGGSSGTGGSGGGGGTRGRGGYSFSYTERYYNYFYKRWLTRRRTSPGGYNGSDGRQGDVGDRGRDGIDGKEGNLEIIVKNSDGGFSTYTRPYDIAIASIDLEIPDNKALTEPGMELLFTPTFINKGGMPSPKNQSLVFDIYSNDHAIATTKVIIDKSLVPGESYTAQTPLKVQLKDDYQPSEKPLNIQTDIKLKLSVSRANKDFHHLEIDRYPLTIQYPLKALTLQQELVFTDGRDANFNYQLSNVGNYNLGGDVGVDTRVEISPVNNDDSTDNKTDLVAIDEVSECVNSNQSKTIEKSFDLIEAKQSIKFKGDIHVDGSQTAMYDSVPYQLKVYLQTVDGSEKCIQRIPFEIQKSEDYKATDADVVLISNTDNDADEMRFWTELCDDLNVSHDVWNMSLFHHFDIYKYLADSNKSLSPNTTFVFLNNKYDSQQQDEVTATEYANREDLFNAMRSRGLNVYVVGESFDMKKALTPQYKDTENIDADSLKDKVGENKAIDLSFPVKKWTFRCQKPDLDEVVKAEKKAREEMSEAYPWMRFNYSKSYQPTPVKDVLLWRKYNVGRVTVAPSVNIKDARITSLNFNSEDDELRQRYLAENADFHAFQLIKLLPFEKKIEGLTSLITKGDQTMKLTYYRAIQADLIHEQNLYRQHDWRGDLSKSTLRQHLSKLDKLCHFKANSREDKLEIEFILLTTKYYGQKFTHFYDHLWFHRRQTDMDDVTSEMIKKWQKLVHLSDTDVNTTKKTVKDSLNDMSKLKVYSSLFTPYATKIKQEEGINLTQDTVAYRRL